MSPKRGSLKYVNWFRKQTIRRKERQIQTLLQLSSPRSLSLVVLRGVYVRCFSFLAFDEGTPEFHSFFFYIRASSQLSGLVLWCRLVSSRSWTKMCADILTRLLTFTVGLKLTFFCFLSRTLFNDLPFEFVSANYCPSGQSLLVRSILGWALVCCFHGKNFGITFRSPSCLFLYCCSYSLFPSPLSLSLCNPYHCDSLSLLLPWIPILYTSLLFNCPSDWPLTLNSEFSDKAIY